MRKWSTVTNAGELKLGSRRTNHFAVTFELMTLSDGVVLLLDVLMVDVLGALTLAPLALLQTSLLFRNWAVFVLMEDYVRVTCSLKRISIFLGWDKPKPTGVSGPETDPVASTTGDLDDYFIGLMEPMMKSLEREDEERVEAPWIKLDHCPPGEEVVQEKRTEFGFVDRKSV